MEIGFKRVLVENGVAAAEVGHPRGIDVPCKGPRARFERALSVVKGRSPSSWPFCHPRYLKFVNLGLVDRKAVLD